MKSIEFDERVLDLLGEGRDDRRGDRVIAARQVRGADHRFADRCQHPLGGHQRLGALPAGDDFHTAQPLGDPQLARDLRARRLGDGLGANLGQAAGAGPRQAGHEVGRDSERLRTTSPRNASRS